MQFILFYLTYPLIYLTASLPFPVLYKISDFFYYIIRLTGYRQKVVLKNLKNSFPEKTAKEIEDISKSYYRYMCDLVLETFKTLTMTEKQAREHCIFHSTPWLDKMCADKQSFVLVMGHYGNWEWAGPAFTLNTGFQLVVIYRPLSNIYFDRMMIRMRTKFGTRITPVQNTLRDMVANRGKLTATAFIADQTASRKNAHWMTFLNQDTAVFTGPEKLAKKFNYPVVFINVKRLRRGYYEVTPELLVNNPQENSEEGAILELFMKRLEQDIVKEPETWLWSHKRWKHKREVSEVTEVSKGAVVEA